MDYQDILYEEKEGVARITINRPQVYNAFRPQTVDELIEAFKVAGWNKEIGVIVFGGAGDKAFCTGGDQSEHEGQYKGACGTTGMPMDELHAIIRNVPKPVIARVQGYAIGGGNVLATICDLTIASENAIFGQVVILGGELVERVQPFGTHTGFRHLGLHDVIELQRAILGAQFLCASRDRRVFALEIGADLHAHLVQLLGGDPCLLRFAALLQRLDAVLHLLVLHGVDTIERPQFLFSRFRFVPQVLEGGVAFRFR